MKDIRKTITHEARTPAEGDVHEVEVGGNEKGVTAETFWFVEKDDGRTFELTDYRRNKPFEDVSREFPGRLPRAAAIAVLKKWPMVSKIVASREVEGVGDELVLMTMELNP